MIKKNFKYLLNSLLFIPNLVDTKVMGVFTSRKPGNALATYILDSAL